MAKTALPEGESRSVQIRRLVVPDWIWQFTWLRHLPRYYRSIIWKDCDRPGWKVVLDMLYLFFKLHIIPEHYADCRLWEHPRSEWVKYFGSPYTPVQWGRFAKRVFPFEYGVLYYDKLVGAQISKGLAVRQPFIYGRLEPDASFRERLVSILASSGHRRLMLKPVFGRSGIGIALVEKTDRGIIVRNSSLQQALDDFRLDWPVFLQEVIRQEASIAAIWNSSVNTIRVITMLMPDDRIILIGAAMRFGVGNSIVDNWSSGGVAIGIDAESGRLKKFGYAMGGKRYAAHPDSGAIFDGFQIPAWDAILETARTIQRELPFSRMTGVDICVDENGKPVLIEINGFPDLAPIEQLNGPLLAKKETLNAFAEYNLLTRPQKRLLAC